MLIFGYVLAIAIGVSLGLIGGGGSILALPILKYVMGVETKEAIAMSLAVVGTVSLIGAIPHWRQGNVNFRAAAIFAPTAMVGAFVGARLSGLPWISDTVQLFAFVAVMIAASSMMIRRSRRKPDPRSESDAKAGHQTWMIPLEGLGVGILTGFVGVGGGFMILPALVLLGGVPMKEAVGTSLLIIAFNSVTGLAGYLGQVTLDWVMMGWFTLAATVGILVGAQLGKSVDGKQLEKGFGYFVLVVAGFVLFQTLGESGALAL